MPDCIDCKWRIDELCTARPTDWKDVPINHVRACVVAITEQYKNLIQASTSVLEIGCGTWSPIREHCLQIGAHWEGIDIVALHDSKPTIATRIESVENLSFPNQTFDFVIGNQSLEHWNENGTRLAVGLWQCFRVCKVGGQVIMNVPIHNHGASIFVKGDTATIKAAFAPYTSTIALETWRKHPHPLSVVKQLPNRFTDNALSIYILDIRATRADEIGTQPTSYRFKHRLWRELIDHRLDYLLYKIARRIGLLS
ncbi:MAG: class I SAM-dependent methyltransferase [Chloroflexota bacterium]